MDIEILAKFPQKKKKSEEDKYLEYTQKLINPDYVSQDEPDFVYDPVTFNIFDIAIFMRLDRDHTQINLRNNSFFIAKVPYDQFKEVYQQVTGKLVTKIVYTTPEEMMERYSDESVLVDIPKKKPRRKKDDDVAPEDNVNE